MPDLNRLFQDPNLAKIMQMLFQQSLYKKGYTERGEIQSNLLEQSLANQLKGYEAFGGERRKTATAQMMNDIIKIFMQAGKEGAKDKDFPIQRIIQGMTPVAEHYDVSFPPQAEEYPQKLHDIATVNRALAVAKRTKNFPPNDILESASRHYGGKWISDWVSDFEKYTAGEAELGVKREAEIGKGKQRELGWAQLGESAKKRLAETTKTKTRKPKEMLTILDKREQTILNEIKDLTKTEMVYDMSADSLDSPEVAQRKKKVRDIRKQKLAILDKMEIDLNMDKINKALEDLRSVNANPEALEKHKEQFKREFKLSELEYQYVKAKL